MGVAANEARAFRARSHMALVSQNETAGTVENPAYPKIDIKYCIHILLTLT